MRVQEVRLVLQDYQVKREKLAYLDFLDIRGRLGRKATKVLKGEVGILETKGSV